MERQPFILAELEDLTPIFAPLKSTSRIKYTCFNVSNNFLIFGATSGGLYVFRREPCVFLQLLPNKEGSVTQVAISPDEKLIAFATVKGTVCILERSPSHGAKQVVTATDHQNAQITCLQWNDQNNELYVGDDTGKVSIVTFSLFPPKNMFQSPSFVLMQLDSKIVQMDLSSDMLLVSTLSRCYVCDTAKELFRQIGHKLRDGEYGACIYNTQDGENLMKDGNRVRDRVGFSLETDKNLFDYSHLTHLKLLCARPGSRIWEVAIDGTVISTHHFKEALAIPPKSIIFQSSSHNSECFVNNMTNLTNGSCLNNEHEQSFNFQKLYIILSKFLLTYKSDGIYIFDPEKSDVVLWNNEITDIVDLRCINDVIYAWSGYGKMFALNLVPLEKFLIRLYFRKKYVILAKMCYEYKDYLKSQCGDSSKLYLLEDLDDKLIEMGAGNETLAEGIKPVIEIFKKTAQNRQTQNSQKLKSGIYLISNQDSKLKSNYLNLKSRSHSVSPDRIPSKQQSASVSSSGSTSSLPDLIQKPERAPDKKLDVSRVTKTCEEIQKTKEPPNELIFQLFDDILTLSCNNEAITSNILQNMSSLPIYSYLGDESIKTITNTFHSALKTKLMFDWLNRFTIGTATDHPNFLLQNHDTKTLELDYKLSKVLKLYDNILDDQILDIVKEFKLECYYLSLLVILDRFQDSSLSSVSESTLNLSNVTNTTKTLNIIYFLIKVGQIEKCSRYSNKINILDVLYLIMRYQDSLLSKTGSKSNEIVELQCQTMFLSYLDKALNRNELISGSSTLIENYIIGCLENINSSATYVRDSNRTCDCGFPHPGMTPSIAMFPEVGYALLEKTWRVDPVKTISVCGKIPFLWKYLIDHRKDEAMITLLPLIIQLGDINEIENRLDEMNYNLFEITVRHLIGLKNGNCLNCGRKLKPENTITWTELGFICVKAIGPQETLELFNKYSSDISPKELDQSFYQSIVFSSIMEKHSKGLRKNVVDLLVGKKDEETMPVFSDKVKTEIFSDDKSLEVNDKSSHHWGVKLEVKSHCASCSLPLDSEVLVSDGGLIVFKCSHAYHSVCLRKIDSECPVCSK